MPNSTLTETETVHRIGTFGKGYGTSLPLDVLSVAVERCAYEAERIERNGQAGVEPYARLLAGGHATMWQSAAFHIDAQRQCWHVAVA
jgi:hypothetical protein